MKKTVLTLAAAFFLLVAPTAALAESFSFTFHTIPSNGAIVGAPGETVGWGYEITNNDPDHYLAIWDLTADTFDYGFPDASIFDYPLLEPGQALTVPYDQASHTGLFEFTWDANVPAGTTNTGTFTLQGDWYDQDLIYVDTTEASADYSVTAVPEPATMGLLATGLVGLVARRSARRKRAR